MELEGREKVRNLLKALKKVAFECVYKTGDNVFALKRGLCVVTLAKTHRKGAEMILDRLNTEIDKYRFRKRLGELTLRMELISYPKEVKTEEELMEKLEGFRLL